MNAGIPIPCGRTGSCPECDAFEERRRERMIQLEHELIQLRTGLVRLAWAKGKGEFIPGKPDREAPYEVIEKLARTHDRGWNALIAHLMD